VSTVGSTATTPVNYDQTLFQFSDTLTMSTGQDTMKFGGDVQRYHFDGFSYSRWGGEFRFTNLQNFMRGNVNRFTGKPAGHRHAAQHAADLRRVLRAGRMAGSNDLTFNYGLRYEFFTIPRDLQNRVAGLLSFDDLQSGPKGVTPGSDFFKNPSKLDFAPMNGRRQRLIKKTVPASPPSCPCERLHARPSAGRKSSLDGFLKKSDPGVTPFGPDWRSSKLRRPATRF